MQGIQENQPWKSWYYGVLSRISKGGEKIETEKEDGQEYKARWWIVEAALSWINRFRKLLVRYEKLSSSYVGLLMFACAFIAFRKANDI
jgi:hypothetical protein